MYNDATHHPRPHPPTAPILPIARSRQEKMETAPRMELPSFHLQAPRQRNLPNTRHEPSPMAPHRRNPYFVGWREASQHSAIWQVSQCGSKNCPLGVSVFGLVESPYQQKIAANQKPGWRLSFVDSEKVLQITSVRLQYRKFTDIKVM
jgi:hypothetical protein